MSRVSETSLVLAPIKSLRHLLHAVSHAKRLVNENPTSTAFMTHRRAGQIREQHARNSDWVLLDHMSPFVICAVIGAEDPVYFQHHGIWWNQVKIATIRALIQREPVRGVSTITQQLARNLFLAPDRSLTRKFLEALLTRRLEASLTKWRILELYLNVAEWGDGLWGIGAAAKEYCGCAPEDLSPFQAVVLVSMLPAPRAPMSGRNAMRALSTQLRLPRFLYSAGLISLLEENETQRRVTQLHFVLKSGMTFAQALPFVTSQIDEPTVNRQAPCTVETLMADQCGWTHRLRFEDFLTRASEHPAVRPLWWTDPAPMIKSLGNASNA